MDQADSRGGGGAGPRSGVAATNHDHHKNHHEDHDGNDHADHDGVDDGDHGDGDNHSDHGDDDDESVTDLKVARGKSRCLRTGITC
jgi:hypothetical protein